MTAKELLNEIDKMIECNTSALGIIELILPMAKAYARANPVGSNAEYVSDAQKFLTKHQVH